MRLFVSGTTNSLRRQVAKTPNMFGFLTSPAAGNKVATIVSFGLPWAVDNGAFTGFDPQRFELLLVRAAYAERKPDWIVCPDKVADADETLRLFARWQYRIAQRDLNVAFVAQDGQEDLSLPPWPLWTCLFIGGSDSFKLSKASRDLAHEAKRRGKFVHMGRVNSLTRLRKAWSFECDSVDGTGMSRWGDRHLEKFARWLSEIEAPRPIFQGA